MRGVRSLLLLMMLLLSVTEPAPGRDLAVPPPRPLDLQDLGAPAFTNFSSRDGLPDSVVVSVRTDREGFVWAATPAGVFRYDGRRWMASRDPAMAHAVDGLWLDHRGVLWAALRHHGLARYDGSHWHVEDARTGLPSLQIRRFAETVDAQGTVTLWALTWDRGLLVRRQGRWQADPGNASLPRGAVLSMAQTRHLGGRRRQWVGMGVHGLWYRDEGTRDWHPWHAPDLDSAQVEYLRVTERHGRESLWMSVFGVGLMRLDDQGLRVWSKANGALPTDDIYGIAATALPNGHHALWIASRAGLLRLHDNRVQVFGRRDGLASDVLRGVHAWRSPDGNEVLWLATEGGVSRTVLGASAWSTASLMGARATGVFGVLIEPDGSGGERLWVGADGDGLGLYQHGRWQHFTAANGALPSPSVSMVAATPGRHGTRTLWIGLRGGDLLRARDDAKPTFRVQPTPWPKSGGQALLDTLVRTADGHREQWFATRLSGVYRWREGRWTAFRPAGLSGRWGVVKLQPQIDAAGHAWLWASSNRGLARFDGRHWTLFGRDIGLRSSELIGLSLIPDAQGRPVLWIGSSGAGIERVDVSDPLHPEALPDTLPPPPDPNAYDALSDASGHIYICTDNGVQKLTPAVGGYRSQVFTRKNGMVNDECNTNAQRIDAHGRYWAGTLGGLAVYDPRHEIRDTLPKPLRITDVQVDGRRTAIGDTGARALRVAAGARTIEIRFALLSWYREDESRFRSQLVGFDDAPGAWTVQDSRTFSALPPGRYRLRLEARDYAGNLSVPIDLPILVAARWWQRPWAYAAAALGLLLLGYAGAQWRIRTLQARRHALERRVAARTAELGQANARLVELSYRDALTGLANRRRLLERMEQASGSTAASPTALILFDVDHFKAYNDTLGHPAGDEALRRVAATMSDHVPPHALLARYGGEEFACLLPGTDAAQALALAERVREAVAACDIPVPGESRTVRVAISAGVASATLADADDAHRLLRDADQALYRAKRDGRNCVRQG